MRDPKEEKEKLSELRGTKLREKKRVRNAPHKIA